eukprot:CAMPEP_0181509678 /NCGR_PEP_ID=MMETSP1110-20121109/60473_1 /TAXON_ID=174948 /ORGANISM="Symbiodinium sp., Strain CCMP421" /LENGTH=53 /DNA_ID=CAMNT_0023639253 /DNA_START=507 /DNA_END=664 /DNA_ORIENTATION=-
MAQNLQTESGNLSISTGVIHISLFPGTKKIRRNLERKAVRPLSSARKESATFP